MKQWQRPAAAPGAAVFFALCLASTPSLAQSSASDGQSAMDKERARQVVAQSEREREQREWREIHRTQDRMRELDQERAEERSRQDADWRREMDERNQRNQATQPAQSGVSSGTRASPAPGPYAPPAPASAPRTTTGSSTTCSARPVCMAASGRANVCMGVQSSYSGSTQAGLADIARRCREANTPEPCSQGKHLNPAAPSYKLDATPALSCAEQCTKVARCERAASR